MALPDSPSDAARRPRLFLLFCLGQDRYALEAAEVAEVLRLSPLKQLPGAPSWVAGVLAHGGALVPVVDLTARVGLGDGQRRTSTRLALVHYPCAGGAARLGLILEQATETLYAHPEDFQPYGMDNQGAPYLGPVLAHAQGLIQRVTVDALLPADVHALLFPDGAATS
ncbi:chemotaxis-related protein WspB [Fluviicoccus keumensis]|uniref:Chemotaxis-related protein WspB n=1 Tax=Fluviicoccus keumensis TaxID=1435465 RepID=A0A4Q7ZCS6_9GAMM|nr:chemotaxis protein CheW [Fluviicoccus keumensis]RZU47689.1 chemotaxis-related protein WspB [Fluviicoccus keumensis]